MRQICLPNYKNTLRRLARDIEMHHEVSLECAWNNSAVSMRIHGVSNVTYQMALNEQ